MESIVNEFNAISLSRKPAIHPQSELLDSDLVSVTIDPELRDNPVYRSQLQNQAKKQAKPKPAECNKRP